MFIDIPGFLKYGFYDRGNKDIGNTIMLTHIKENR